MHVNEPNRFAMQPPTRLARSTHNRKTRNLWQQGHILQSWQASNHENVVMNHVQLMLGGDRFVAHPFPVAKVLILLLFKGTRHREKHCTEQAVKV